MHQPSHYLAHSVVCFVNAYCIYWIVIYLVDKCYPVFEQLHVGDGDYSKTLMWILLDWTKDLSYMVLYLPRGDLVEHVVVEFPVLYFLCWQSVNRSLSIAVMRGRSLLKSLLYFLLLLERSKHSFGFSTH